MVKLSSNPYDENILIFQNILNNIVILLECYVAVPSESGQALAVPKFKVSDYETYKDDPDVEWEVKSIEKVRRRYKMPFNPITRLSSREYYLEFWVCTI